MTEPLVRTARLDQVVAARDHLRPAWDHFSAVVPAGYQLYLRGWVAGEEQSTICAQIDEGECFPVVRGLPRPDVAEAFGDERLSSAGFEVFIDTTGLGDGEHIAKLVIPTAPRDAELLASSPFRIGSPWPRTTLTWLRAGGNISYDLIQIGDVALKPFARTGVIRADEILKIQGWAFNGLQKTAGIAAYIVIDELDAIRIRYGLERADVAAAYGDENVRYCGFRSSLDLSAYDPGTHSLRIVILMEDGSGVAAEDSLVFRLTSSTNGSLR